MLSVAPVSGVEEARLELATARADIVEWKRRAEEAEVVAAALEARARDAESRVGDLESMKRTNRHTGAATGRQLAELQSKLDSTVS